MNPINIFWFRRDLRLEDNRGLYHALQGDLPVLTLFIFDTNILNDLPDNDSRVTFIHDQVNNINNQLKSKGTSLLVRYGSPEEIWKKITIEYDVKNVYVNDDYEPYARDRDQRIAHLLQQKNIVFKPYKDHVLLEKSEVLKADGSPYVVFTPYSRAWLKTVSKEHQQQSLSALQFNNFVKVAYAPPISLSEMGFTRSEQTSSAPDLSDLTLQKYQQLRDFPADQGTSRIGVHLRFGTISIREIATRAYEKSRTFLNELIWREFYQMILWHFPRVVNENFQTKYNQLKWRNNPAEFDAWCQGKTGYPIVDAGMRQLNQTGFMHNRVRMITASFLTKHLLIDWRWGEAYFASRLMDYELASNNGGWQWAAGTGVDAAPYFRIFNPELQTKKFDPELKYIKKWVPEFQELTYPKPIVDHKIARDRAIKTYKQALES